MNSKRTSIILFLACWFFVSANAQPTFGFARGFVTVSGGGIETLLRATNEKGEITFAGYFSGDVDFDKNGAGKVLHSKTERSFFIARYTSSGELKHAKEYPCTGSNVSVIRGLRLDASDNIYCSSSFDGKITFSETTLLEALPDNKHSSFIVKFDPQGNVVFAKQLNNFKNLGFAIDSSGNCYLGGSFKDVSPDYDPSEKVVQVKTNGNENGHVAKYDSTGRLLYVKVFYSQIYADVKFIEVCDAKDAVYLGLQYRGELNFDPEKPEVFMTSIENEDTDNLVVKLTESGEFIWANPFGGKGGDNINQMAVDHEGNLIVSGNFMGPLLSFDAKHSMVNEGGLDGFVAKFSCEHGALIWARHAGGTGWETIYGIGISPKNHVLATGRFDSPALGLNQTSSLETTGGLDAFYMLLNGEDGSIIWANSFGSPGGEDRTGCSRIDHLGRFYLIGYLSSPAVDLDPSSDRHSIAQSGGPLFFFAQYTCNEDSIVRATSKSGAWNVAVFPNPTDGLSFLEITGLPAATPVTITVYNLSGDLVMTTKSQVGSQFIMLNTESWARGSYLIEIEEPNGTKMTATMIRS